MITISIIKSSKCIFEDELRYRKGTVPNKPRYISALPMSLIKFSISVLVLSILWSCSGKLDTGSIDTEAWKNDRYGCAGLRIQYLDEIKAIKNSFLGKNNQEIILTFGRPDRVELVDKSQSFFFYFLEPSSSCEGVDTEKEPLKVLFRFNAISKVSEVTVTTLNP
jgi:hypothetical protein